MAHIDFYKMRVNLNKVLCGFDNSFSEAEFIYKVATVMNNLLETVTEQQAKIEELEGKIGTVSGGWTREQIDLLEDVLNELAYASEEDGQDLADELISKLREAPVVYATVKFDLDGKGENFEQTVEVGRTVNEPTPTAQGYKLVGWTYNGQPWVFSNPVLQSMTLKANWVQAVTYTVTFKTGSQQAEMPDVQYVMAGEKAQSVQPLSAPMGYRFAYWSYQGSAFNFNTAITQNVELTAEWVRQYKVMFYVGGYPGISIPNQNVDAGGYATPPTVPSITGYRFDGWYADADRDVPFIFSEHPIVSDVGVYGVYVPVQTESKVWLETVGANFVAGADHFDNMQYRQGASISAFPEGTVPTKIVMEEQTAVSTAGTMIKKAVFENIEGAWQMTELEVDSGQQVTLSVITGTVVTVDNSQMSITFGHRSDIPAVKYLISNGAGAATQYKFTVTA